MPKPTRMGSSLKKNAEHRHLPSAVALLIIVLGPTSSLPVAAAEPPETHWTVRLYGAGLFPAGSDVEEAPPSGATFGVSSGTGFGLELAYRFTPRLSVEGSYLVGDYDADLTLETGVGRITDRENITSETISVAANYHFTPDRRTDVFTGIVVAMSTFDGVVFLTEQGLREKRPFDDDVGFGLLVGVDIPLGSESRWTVNATVRYLLVIMEAESASGGRDFDLHPIIPSIGIGYRF